MAYLLIQILYNPINTDLTKYFINDSVVKEYWDYIMHLTYSDSKYKGKTYKSYSIAESYRDGKKVRKRILWPIGKLSDIQAEQIKLICKTVENTDQLQTQLKDVAVLESRAYLDIAVVNELWNQWQLDQAFDYDVTAGALPTNMIAKILTINRCTDPCSHYSIPHWAKKERAGGHS
ncbi:MULTISPECIES: hypothetical protein [Candidatus Kuenenia]|uniref:hypothetical protein n=1 Tax=Candidatus Kuenenia TaxID=380738 RepID=UPI00146A7C81|nr:hypothetical protein [Candidatus Kuenenia stuttgartiensis]